MESVLGTETDVDQSFEDWRGPNSHKKVQTAPVQNKVGVLCKMVIKPECNWFSARFFFHHKNSKRI